MIPRKRQPKPDRSAEFASFRARPRECVLLIDPPARAVVAVPKEPKPVRSKPYRMLVASLPCVLTGRIDVQAAHGNRGKGQGLKTCDLTCFPLSIAAHREWDTYKFGREWQAEHEPIFAAQTQAALIQLAQADRKARDVLVRVGLIQPSRIP